MVVDKFEVPRKQIISDLGGKHGAGQHPELVPGDGRCADGPPVPCRAQPERGALHPRTAQSHDLRGAGGPAGQGRRYSPTVLGTGAGTGAKASPGQPSGAA